jgi:glucosamine 6-phosphate synthetase-like amidotransferase/phosphosugar isomerase protein
MGHFIAIPRTHSLLATVPALVALQACHVVRIRSCDIDQLRNLVKSITVEGRQGVLAAIAR